MSAKVHKPFFIRSLQLLPRLFLKTNTITTKTSMGWLKMAEVTPLKRCYPQIPRPLNYNQNIHFICTFASYLKVFRLTLGIGMRL